MSNANVRSCANTSCGVVATFAGGTVINVLASESGATVAGSAVWYQVRLNNGGVGYIHSSLAQSGVRTVVQATSRPPSGTGGGGGGAPSLPAATSAPAVAQSPFGCNGIDDLNCSDFRAIGQNANAHLAACGDEDNLDGDGDGRACER